MVAAVAIMTLAIRPSLTPGHVIIPRALIMELAKRAIDWKRQQLAEQGHQYPHLLRTFEPSPDCKVVDGWIEPACIGIWQTDEVWILRVRVADHALQLRRRV